MAHSVDLEKYVDELTTCPICLEDLVNPKLLPCVHTFCVQCIRDHCRDSSPGASINCPVCRSSFVIPGGGVDQLPNNFMLQGLTGAKRPPNKPAGLIPCTGCSDPSEATASSLTITPATRQCIACGQNMCHNCSKPHGKMSGHDMIPLGSELHDEVVMSQGRFCSQHPMNRLEMYCIECEKNVCITCQSVHHGKHNCRKIKEVYVEFQDMLKRDIKRMLDREKIIQHEATTLGIEQQRGMDSVLRKETDLSEFAVEIRHRVDDAISQIMVQLSNEKTELSKLANDKKTLLEFELSSCQSFTSYTSELVKNGKPCDITEEYIELHSRAEELLQRGLKTHDCQQPARDVSPGDLFDDVFDFVSNKSAKHRMQEQNVSCKMNKLEQERDAINKQLLTLTADSNANAIRMRHLESKKEDLEHGKDECYSHITTLKLLVEQLQKEKEDIKKQFGCREEDILATEKKKENMPSSHLLPLKYASSVHQPPTQIASNLTCSSDDGSSYVNGIEQPILRCILFAGDPVVALTCLRNELFVLRHSSRQEIRIYDTLDFKFKGILRVDCLSDDTRWCGMTSCAANDCIYVSDSFKDAVYRVHSETEYLWTWNVGSRPNGLSSTHSGKIIIAYFKASMLQEFTRSGSFLREISLQGCVHHPIHAILLNSGYFIVSHHGPHYGISVVDAVGRVLGQCANNQFDYQRYMAVDHDRYVMVADSNSNRILVLDLIKHTVNDMCLPIGGGLIEPWSLYYDKSRSRLYVGEYEGYNIATQRHCWP